ncbi:MAG: TatD family hydrolase [Deltaproteobacteria bacterium]|nr:TatD family hydrolase [Deltaproteobacteria bacterium]
MNRSQTTFVDSHVHLDLVYRYQPDRIEWYRQVGCLPVSWAFAEHVHNVADLKSILNKQRETIHELREGGLDCFYLTGIHPRNIPPDLIPEKIEKILLPFLEDPVCLGIGEIGLELASRQEKEIFAAQLEMAPQICPHNKILGVHTPRDDKARVTGEVLSILKEFKAWHHSIVVDHCLPDTIAGILEDGFWAGITLSIGKASFEDLNQIVKDHPNRIERMMLNTDSGIKFSEDLYRLYFSQPYPADIQTRLYRENALEFFGIQP